MRARHTITLAAVVLFAMVACSLPSTGATQIFYDTQFYLYAVSADNWVRNDVRYTPNRLRAADGISKGEATRFTAMTNNGPAPGTPLTTGSLIALKSLTGSHPWCVPTNTNTGLINATILCETNTQTTEWLLIYKQDGNPLGAPIYAGDTVRFASGVGGCAAPPWPTNGAALYCAGTGQNAWLDFHIEV